MIKTPDTGISAAVIMLDEEKLIGDFLDRLIPYVDEVVVVDGGSTDRSVNIARKKKVKLLYKKWNHNFPEQKNFAIDACTKEWVLSIDVDEYLSEKFIEFLNIVRTEKVMDHVEAFSIPHRHFIEGRELFSMSHNMDRCIKMFRNNGVIKFSTESPVSHCVEGIYDTPESVVSLKGNICFIHERTRERVNTQKKYYNKAFFSKGIL